MSVGTSKMLAPALGNNIGKKLEKTLEGIISALENTQNVLEWFQENESKNKEETVKNGVEKTKGN